MGKRISFEERYEACREASYNKNQLFLGFFCSNDKVNTKTKCKLYCKSSGRYWETTSVEKHLGRKGCPCGECSYTNMMTKSKDSIINKIKEVEEHYNIDFLGFKDDNYIGTTTKVILRCRKHHTIWDTTEARYIIDRSCDKGSGCKLCKKEIILALNDSKDESIIKDLKDNYGFLEGTEFWRSERTTSGNARNYWKYTCPKCSVDEYVKEGLCSGIFEGFIGTLKEGVKSCRCSNAWRWTPEQKEYNLRKAVKDDKISFVSWVDDNTERVNLECKECNNEWDALYYNIISNGNRCPSCAKARSFWGLYKDRLDDPDNLYLFHMKREDEIFYKIGRSFNIDTRIKDIKPYYEATLVGSWENIHEVVFRKEKELHKTVKPFKYEPDYKFGGETECFTEEILSHPEIISTFNLHPSDT
ncbi:hypothetical protein [Pseudoalteromonas phage PH357]|nr:hypothetical protein [Pseudoalteromonas phage PH357]